MSPQLPGAGGKAPKPPHKSTYADPFVVFPVAGPHNYSDDFGAPRYSGGYHTHQGNDIMAAKGVPIVAPFAGLASPIPNSLGGRAVFVNGALGHVYNAHLDRYGRMGPVEPGAVIGYVGNSGDAAGGPTHDHFEWHPHDGPAVDPYPFLRKAEGRSAGSAAKAPKGKGKGAISVPTPGLPSGCFVVLWELAALIVAGALGVWFLAGTAAVLVWARWPGRRGLHGRRREGE